MYELSVKGRFSAAHRLRDYAGACASVHGHNWDVEVFVRGASLDRQGMLVDFRVMRESLREALAELDHTDLNVAGMLEGRNPTSEVIAACLFRRLSAVLNAETRRVHRVAVYETPESRATFGDDDD
jgi:6-pyruvoyltetrahydropterin/6-carboxytetrahydropterin synthase